MSDKCAWVKAFLAGIVVGLLIAAAICAWRAQTKVETPAVEARQSDGSLVLERKPGKPKPAHIIPKGGKVERVVSVDVQPERADCPLCRVDLSLVRMKDGTRRVVASSPYGNVLGGLDAPAKPLFIDKEHLWAAGISVGTGPDAFGGWVDRDFDFLGLRVGGEIYKNGDGNIEGRVKAGFRF